MDAFITRKRPRIVVKPESTEGTRDASISPPPKRKSQKKHVSDHPVTVDLTGDDDEQDLEILSDTVRRKPFVEPRETFSKGSSCNTIPSPIQLNHVDGLPVSSNVDTLKLSDILGDPMIKECWLFNYLFDINFVMQQFDPDTRDLIKIKVVHGSWKAEDSNGIGIIEGSRRFPNIQSITAYMPEAFGTHHSKMIVLFRHDDMAQVIILTANFIKRDWSMSQAIWKTPLLPLRSPENKLPISPPPLGSGPRLKHDLLAYFRGYGPSKLQALITQLQQYDFSTVRGALIASVPGRQHPQSVDPDTSILWGWPGLKNILRRIPSTVAQSPDPSPIPQIIIQVSSVASVGENWLKGTIFPTLSATPPAAPLKTPSHHKISLIFPTADTIRRSVTGYTSGASIHMKTSSAPQAKQLAFLHPLLHHWAPPSQHPSPFASATTNSNAIHQAGRRRAAPHIKTYIRFNSPQMESIEWAMLTSANLSTQAWGSAAAGMGEVRICSYEVGVVVWPELFAGDGDGEGYGEGARVVMVPTFRRDTVDPEMADGRGEERLVAWRMPYDLPLLPYAKGEKPWCASEADGERDWMGRVWDGYQR